EPPPRSDAAKEESLRRMREHANRLIVRVPSGSETGRAELADAPLIHYADEVRRLTESTMWVWHQEGLPVLFCKIELLTARTGKSSWQYCCVPAPSEKADVEWAREYRGRSRDTSFKRVLMPDAAEPRDQPAARLTQMKAIARAFGGETEQTP